MFSYTHHVQYYETDKMGVTHHSNYIRWMEEARGALLDSINLGYDRMEQMGLISPVTGITCEYRAPTTFHDDVRIDVRITGYNGVMLTVDYVMSKQDKVVLTGTSSHTLLTPKGSFARMKRDFPEVDALFRRLVEPK